MSKIKNQKKKQKIARINPAVCLVKSERKNTWYPQKSPFDVKAIEARLKIENFKCPYFGNMPSLEFPDSDMSPILDTKSAKRAKTIFINRWNKIAQTIENTIEQLNMCDKCPRLTSCTSLTLVRISRNKNNKK